MTTFRPRDEAAAVELASGAVRYGSVLEAGEVFATFRSDGGFAATFRQEDGLIVPRGHAGSGGHEPGWRLVRRCESCEMPALTPVADPEDRSGRVFCSEGCLTAEAEGSHVQRYGPGVAT